EYLGRGSSRTKENGDGEIFEGVRARGNFAWTREFVRPARGSAGRKDCWIDHRFRWQALGGSANQHQERPGCDAGNQDRFERKVPVRKPKVWKIHGDRTSSPGQGRL